MTKGHTPKFEPDPYFEKLLKLRTTDPAAYSTLPDDAKKLVEEYEREKRAARSRGEDTNSNTP